jgi:hypothetical protein
MKLTGHAGADVQPAQKWLKRWLGRRGRASAVIDQIDELAQALEPNRYEYERAVALEDKFERRAAPVGESAGSAAAMRAELQGTPETRMSAGPKFELREVPNGTGGTHLRFTGFASTTGDDSAYEMEDFAGSYTESISVGSFKRTLQDGPDCVFLLNHAGMSLARTKPGTLRLSEVTDGARSPVYGVTGLHTEALLDPQNMFVQAMRSAVERGDLDEMSFSFKVLRQEWSKDWTRRRIQEVSLHHGDVSLVNYGANANTAGTVALRQRLPGRSSPLGYFADDERRIAVEAAAAREETRLFSEELHAQRRRVDVRRVEFERNRYPKAS